MQIENEKENVKPGWILLAISIIVLLLPVCYIFGAGYDYLYSEKFLNIASLIIMTVPMLIISMCVYNAIFQRNKLAAEAVAWISLGLAAFSFLVLVTNVGEAISEGNYDISLLISFGCFFLLMTVFFVYSWLVMLKWSKRLAVSITGDQRSVPVRKKKMVVILIAIYLVSFFTGIACGRAWGKSKFFGQSAPAVSWLPKSATNVSYYFGYLDTAYEFDISVDEFLKLAKYKRWRLKEIVEPFRVNRYSYYLPSYFADEATSEDKTLEIKTGYFYESERASDGGGFDVAYDTSKGRAYYRYWPR